MGKKYIIEFEDKPFVSTSNYDSDDELYRAVGFNALVFDQNGLDKLEEYDGDKYDFDKVYDEAYQNGLDKAWDIAKKLVWDTCVKDLEDMGLLDDGETFESGKVLEKYTASEAIGKVKEYENNNDNNNVSVDNIDVNNDDKKVFCIKDYKHGLNDAWEAIKEIYNTEDSADWIDKMKFDLHEFGWSNRFKEILFNHNPSEIIDKLKKYKEEQDAIHVGDEVIPDHAISEPFVVFNVNENGVYGFDEKGIYRGCSYMESTFTKTGRHFPEVAKLLNRMGNEGSN